MECGLDPLRIVDRKIDAPRAPAFVMILFHRQADGAIVDNRDHLPQVLREQTEEEDLVAIVKRRQVNVLPQRIG